MRINIRVDTQRKAVIARAAQLRHTTLSDFVLETAYQSASEIIADETSITMTKVQFEHLCNILDNPPQVSRTKLQTLLNKKTVFDE